MPTPELVAATAKLLANADVDYLCVSTPRLRRCRDRKRVHGWRGTPHAGTPPKRRCSHLTVAACVKSYCGVILACSTSLVREQRCPSIYTPLFVLSPRARPPRCSDCSATSKGAKAAAEGCSRRGRPFQPSHRGEALAGQGALFCGKRPQRASFAARCRALQPSPDLAAVARGTCSQRVAHATEKRLQVVSLQLCSQPAASPVQQPPAPPARGRERSEDVAMEEEGGEDDVQGVHVPCNAEEINMLKSAHEPRLYLFAASTPRFCARVAFASTEKSSIFFTALPAARCCLRQATSKPLPAL